MNRYIILLSLILNISCEKAIDINLPSQQSKLVINGSLISNKYWDGYSQYIYISNSIEGLGSVNDYEYTDSVPVINYASVNILEMENENEIIEEFQFEFDNDCYCYSNNNFMPKENSNYQLKVTADNFPEITAFETMPSETDFNISNELYLLKVRCNLLTYRKIVISNNNSVSSKCVFFLSPDIKLCSSCFH